MSLVSRQPSVFLCHVDFARLVASYDFSLGDITRLGQRAGPSRQVCSSGQRSQSIYLLLACNSTFVGGKRKVST